jgi:hypothetical protein
MGTGAACSGQQSEDASPTAHARVFTANALHRLIVGFEWLFKASETGRLLESNLLNF